jgi:glycopeptide antibiotics resistance protein
VIPSAHYSPGLSRAEATKAPADARARYAFTDIRRRTATLAALLVWILFIVAIVVPWSNLQDHTHWGKVAWIPFVSPPIKLTDIIDNALLYVPLGYWYRRLFRGPVALCLGVALAAMLSVSTEASQLFSHWRFPSATDVTMNLLGACGGLYFGQFRIRLVRDELSLENRS